MNAAEVIKREPASDAGPVILPFFAEGICKAREASIAHARARIAAFHNRGTYSLGIRLSEDWDNLHGLHFGGAISRFAILGGPIDLDKLGKASQSIMQRRSNGRSVGSEAIRCDLKFAACSRGTDAFNKGVRGALIAFPHRDVEHQFAGSFDGDKNVGVAKVLIVFGNEHVSAFSRSPTRARRTLYPMPKYS